MLYAYDKFSKPFLDFHRQVFSPCFSVLEVPCPCNCIKDIVVPFQTKLGEYFPAAVSVCRLDFGIFWYFYCKNYCRSENVIISFLLLFLVWLVVGQSDSYNIIP